MCVCEQAIDVCWQQPYLSVTAVLEVALDMLFPKKLKNLPEVTAQAVAYFRLWLTEHMAAALTPETYTATAVDRIMRALACTARHGITLANADHPVRGFVDRCREVRVRVEEIVGEYAESECREATFPPKLLDVCGRDTYRDPKVTMPADFMLRKEGTSVDALRLRAETNLGWLPHLPEDASFTEMEQFLQHAPWGPWACSLATQHALRAVERLLFYRASHGFEAPHPDKLESEIEALETATERYRLILDAFLAHEDAFARMIVPLRGRETVVVWISYCLTYAAALKCHSTLLGDYSTALCYSDLEHLALDDREALDAARQVSAYLIGHAKKPAVFSLREEIGTFDMAERYALADPAIMHRWRVEQENAAARQEAHWEEVQRKQALAAQLRNEMTSLKRSMNSTLESWTAALTDAEAYENRSDKIHLQRRCDTYKVDYNGLVQQAVSKQRALDAAEQSPEPVLQPLPANQPAALRVLFFLMMPKLFRLLSRASFTAQQMLMPRPQGKWMKDAETTLKSDWTSYYNSHQGSWYNGENLHTHNGVCGQVLLASLDVPPKANTVGPSHVDSITDSCSGVWHPDNLRLGMQWNGGGFALDTSLTPFDPFKAMDPKHLVTYNTEQVSKNYQWAMEQHGSRTDTSRGNLSFERQSEKSVDLSKSEFLTFGAFRSYPHMQIRKLCTLLRDRTMPLKHSDVQILICQSLYHVGDLEAKMDGELPLPRWKTDIFRPELGVLEALRGELKDFSDELKQTPSNSESAKMIGLLAAYFSGWDTDAFRPIARDVAAAATAWADDMQSQVDESELSGKASLQARQCRFRCIAMLCHGVGDLSEQDARDVCNLAVLINTWAAIPSEEPEVASLKVQSQNAIAGKIVDVLCHINGDNPHALTAAVRLVLQSAPNSLDWKPSTLKAFEGKRTACFEALGDDGHLYSINVLSGVVLTDGSPPNTLPLEIVTHPLYVRVFGDRNFNVIPTEDEGVLQTACAVDSVYLYEFRMTADGWLVIHEICKREGKPDDVLELLDGAHAAKWSADLPVRLRELHSHWYCRTERVVLLRPHLFSEREVDFVLKLPDAYQPDVSVGCQCMQITSHLRATDWMKLIDSEQFLHDKLVLHDSVAKDIFCKFESEEFVHTYESIMKQTLVFSLPRFKIEFELFPVCAGRHEGKLVSKNYTGYILKDCQKVHDTLHGLAEYLVLELDDPNAHMSLALPAEIMLFPDNQVLYNIHGGFAYTNTNLYSGAILQIHTIHVHRRFRHLQADNILARLHLAALYAATSSLLPEARTSVTGAETALELLRGCWVNRPLTPEEYTKLQNVAQLSRDMPAVKLLCYDLEKSASCLGYLFGDEHDEDAAPKIHQDSASAYLCERAASPHHLRRELTADEETNTIGILRSQRRSARVTSRFGNIELGPCPVAPDIVSEIETQFEEFLEFETKTISSEFPLPASEKPNALEESMWNDLVSSWSAHHRAPNVRLKFTIDEHLFAFEKTSNSVSEKRRLVEQYLLDGLTSACVSVPTGIQSSAPSGHWENHARDISIIANLLPAPRVHDLMKVAWQTEHIDKLNSLLTEPSRRAVAEAAVTWMELCVLEDQLERMIAMCKAAVLVDPKGPPPPQRKLLIQELQTIRTWNSHEHPQWLTFEVEGRLKIRPVQYRVAQHLMQNPGAIAQLNMGEGKTRIILPMLILHWANREQIVRLCILAPLLTEAFDFLHLKLSAGVLGRKICLLPFNREVEVDEERLGAIHATLERCSEVGGLLMVAREHRLSLDLKWHDFYGKGESDTCAMIRRLQGMPYLDLFDESDELLRHKFQLIYAVGNPVGLPDGPRRWGGIQAILAIIRRGVRSPQDGQSPSAIARILSNPSLARQELIPGCDGAESFRKLRLLPGTCLQAHEQDFIGAIAEELLSNQTQELAWLSGEGRDMSDSQLADFKGRLLRCMCDATESVASILDGTPSTKRDYSTEPLALLDKEMADVLTFRGMLAYGILLHCLKQRHRVDFGVSQSGKKRLAIPFRACDTPAERTEFGHSEIALTFTMLSYYYDGLSRNQVKAAVAKLLAMGPIAQKEIYATWFQLSKSSMSDEHRRALDNVQKIDLSNEQQLTTVFNVYRYNVEVINHWLNYIILPVETMQYPSRLQHSAWHLADNALGTAVGFSGTRDNSRLLPLQMKQAEVEEDPKVPFPIRGTDGKMLEHILENPEYITLSAGAATALQVPNPQRTGGDGTAVWCAVLNLVVERGADALIDCGALMNGATPAEAAENLLPRLNSKRFQGVKYFDTYLKQWAVLDRLGRRLDHRKSSIRDRDAFAYFDESHCRGADLELRHDAAAIVTVGPGMCKDKLMQAAGRMRMLGRSQTLSFTGTEDISAQIQDSWRVKHPSEPPAATFDALTSRHLLSWVLHNTVEATAHGLLEWATQGVHFSVAKANSDSALLPEQLELSEFYAGARSTCKVSELISHAVDVSDSFWGSASNGKFDTKHRLEQIKDVGKEFGSDLISQSKGLDDECERELEREEEEEEEVERSIPKAEALKEYDWSYSAALGACGPEDMPHDAGVVLLQDAFKALLSAKGSDQIGWSPKVYCTRNFFRTVARQQSSLDGEEAKMDEYLRLVDVYIFWPSTGALVLMSDREADAICAHMWALEDGDMATTPRLMHLAFSRPGEMGGGVQSRQGALALPSSALDDAAGETALFTSELVTLQVLAGETMLAGEALPQQLRVMLPNEATTNAAGEIVGMRGMLHMLSHSVLERELRIMASERL